jgi:LCP family protein required for cell wall assembly
MKYLFRDSSKLSKKALKRKKRAKRTAAGLALVALQIILTVLFLFRIITLQILPVAYVLGITAVLILITLYDFTSQFSKAHSLGKFLAILMSVVLLFGFIFTTQIASTLNLMSGTTKTDIIDVIVLSDDSAESIKDALSYNFGYNSSVNSSVITQAITEINSDYKSSIATTEYKDWSSLINALYANSEIKAIIMNDSLISTLSEDFEDFETKTKIIGSVKITTEVKLSASDKKVNEEPFVVYISGNDGYGTVTSNGRSDVNILAFVNPITRQVLLLSTPRDYYITIEDANGNSGLDKLTHAGNAGIEYSVSALENLYNISVDYYVKINFTGCVKVVDALGGITINSSVDFTNGQDAAPISYHFVIGENECDGEKTLAFVRERQAFADGDFQRGRNQSAAITAIINKATSPSILGNYSSVLSAVSDMILTNMPTSTITALIKGQLSNGTSWNVQSYSVSGTPVKRDCTVYGLSQKSVDLPDYDTVNIACDLINKINNGEVFDVDEYVSSVK